MKKPLLVLSLLGFLILPLRLHADTPLKTVEGHLNNALDVLSNPALKGDNGKELKRKKIELVADAMFDYTFLSRLTLSRSWKEFNPEQRKEFITLYRSLLKKVYMDRILSYENETIVFDRETMLSEKKAEVQTRLISSSREIPILYRVILKGGEWKVYDVIIEGVSLVKNYRTQFKEILGRKSPDELLEMLREKVGKAQPG